MHVIAIESCSFLFIRWFLFFIITTSLEIKANGNRERVSG